MNSFTNSADDSFFIPYGRQWIDEDDIQSVVDVLRSDWLTTGPKVSAFEDAVADYVGAKYAVAVNSGTAALHAAMYAVDVKPGDEVILPPMTFVATANCIVYQGGNPIFTDVNPDNLLIDSALIEEKITSKTKAIIAVDYAGHPCEYAVLRHIADKNGIYLISDACHALGARYKGKMVGSLADMSVFSFHPVKHITTGEGGMVVTDETKFAERMRRFRNHGITRDLHQRRSQGTWSYDMVDLGYNYRITDIQCALGLSQLDKLPGWIKRRQEIARHYNEAFTEIPAIEPIAVKNDVYHAYHLYVCRVNPTKLDINRDAILKTLWTKGLGINVHYIPVHLHPFYRTNFATKSGSCMVAETAYKSIISLPIFPQMTEQDMKTVISSVREILI